VWIVGWAFIILLLFFALVGAQVLLRGTPVDRVLDLDGRATSCRTDEPEFAVFAEFAAHTRLDPGVRIERLDNGAVFPRLWSDLQTARRSITILSYFAKPGRVAERLADILIDRARAGVAVFWVRDAVGSGPLNRAWFDRLRSAGIHIAVFRPVRWYKLDRAINRSHMRAIVVDGATGYTGGFGFDDNWLGDGEGKGEWRDCNVRVTGVAVGRLQSAFIAHWAEAANELLVDNRLLESCAVDETGGSAHGSASRVEATTEPTDGVAGDTVDAGSVVRLAGIMTSSAHPGTTNAERLLALTVGASRDRLHITNAYFVPDAEFIDMLCDASRRGVDVRVLTNGPRVDVPFARFAGRRRYDKLLAAGVHIYEYEPTVLHSKTVVADGIWCSIGTVNFDNRSLAFNDEVSALILDEAFGASMHATFMTDLERATEIRLDGFRRRSFAERAKERFADLIWRWL
jgi:cardiolipin synthase A/B